jgi:hypothetical protein
MERRLKSARMCREGFGSLDLNFADMISKGRMRKRRFRVGG